MPKSSESGKVVLMKGSLSFLWEELKTMNMRKFRALSIIAKGYLRMKFAPKKTPRKIAPRRNDYQSW